MRNSPSRFGYVIILALTAASATANARVCTWVARRNASFSTSSSWTCSQGSGPPGAADTIQFVGARSTRNCSIPASTTVSSLTIGSGYSGTVTLSAPLTVSGDLTLESGTLNAGSDALQAGSITSAAARWSCPAGPPPSAATS